MKISSTSPSSRRGDFKGVLDREIPGKKRILENIHADDPRVPTRLSPPDTDEPSAKRQRDGASLLAVQCGPGETGHLVAVIISDGQTLRSFRDKNPELCRVVTAWNRTAAVWLSIDGHVPRSLALDLLNWASELWPEPSRPKHVCP